MKPTTKFTLKRRALAAVTIIGMVAFVNTTHAKEGGDQYPNGAENWYAGAVPPAGNYFINYAGYYSGTLRDGNGDKANVGGSTPKVNATFDALRFVHVTNTKILGADWAMHVIVPLVHQNIDIAPLGGSASKSGLGDITVDPIVLAWHSPKWHYAAGLDINLPTGAYDKNDARKSIGANYYSFEPIAAVSYLDKGYEVSAKFMYNVKTRNNDTHYQSGDEAHMDFLVGKNIKNWGLGVSGYYLKQTSNDTQNGAVVGSGNRGEVFALGPSVKYSFAKGTTLVGQWQHEVSCENRFCGDKYMLKLIMPL